MRSFYRAVSSQELRRGPVCNSPADRQPGPLAVPATVTEVHVDLLELFGSVTDGRSGQGRDHPAAVVLALAAAAVVAGMKGDTAIADWVKDCPAAGAGGFVPAGLAPLLRGRRRRRRSGG
jgi:hypothetical protein